MLAKRQTRQSVKTSNGTRLFKKLVIDANIVDCLGDFGLDLPGMLTKLAPNKELRRAFSSHRLRTFKIPGQMTVTEEHGGLWTEDDANWAGEAAVVHVECTPSVLPGDSLPWSITFSNYPLLKIIDLSGFAVSDAQVWTNDVLPRLFDRHGNLTSMVVRTEVADKGWVQSLVDTWRYDAVPKLANFCWWGPVGGNMNESLETTPLLDQISTSAHGPTAITLSFSFTPPVALEMAMINHPRVDTLRLLGVSASSYYRYRFKLNGFLTSREMLNDWHMLDSQPPAPWYYDHSYDLVRMWQVMHKGKVPSTQEMLALTEAELHHMYLEVQALMG
jgi:hypothetical protein